MNYTDENIEYAHRILHRRHELDDREVAGWLQDTDNLKLLEEMTNIKGALSSSSRSHLKKSLLDRILRQISRKRYRLLYRTLAATAAAVLLLAGTFLFLWNSSEAREDHTPELAHHIRPGSSKGILYLAHSTDSMVNQSLRSQGNEILRLVEEIDPAGEALQVITPGGQVKEEFHRLLIPPGGFYKMELRDGSSVWLNADSELKIPVNFGEKTREVALTGEGYFDITKDPTRPFTLHLKAAKVTVLGTILNISAYDNEEHIVTTLVNGSVRFYTEKTGEEIILKPGMQSRMDVHTGEMTVERVETEPFISWINGQFSFRSLKLDAILRQLQRWYDFELVYQNPEVKENEFRGVINRDMAIKDVFDILEETTDARFDIEGRTVIVRK